jgi:hypothetical protein
MGSGRCGWEQGERGRVLAQGSERSYKKRIQRSDVIDMILLGV